MAHVLAPPRFTHYTFPGEFRLAVNSNKKMKTVQVTANFLGNLDEAVTRMALVPVILRRGTRQRPDMQSISRYLEGLYGASLASFVQKVGEWHVVRFRLEVVNERFIPGERGLLRRGLEFLREVLCDPLEVSGGFHPEFLEQEKTNLKLAIESLVDNKGVYAEHRLIEEMCSREPYRLYEQGRIEDIPGIDARSLREDHRRWAARHPLSVYVAGDVDERAARDLVASVFSSTGFPREGGYPLAGIPRPVEVRTTREVEETMDVNQAKLVLGFRHGITYADREYEALLLMNGVLGGFSHSKLFQNVREKASLCYSVHSAAERTKGLLFISAGIAPEHHRKALDIMLEQVDSLKKGDVSDDELGATVLTILNSNEMLEDNFAALADVDYVWSLHGRELDLEAFRERLKRTRKDDVVAAARRLRHDTSYLLTK